MDFIQWAQIVGGYAVGAISVAVIHAIFVVWQLRRKNSKDVSAVHNHMYLQVRAQPSGLTKEQAAEFSRALAIRRHMVSR